MLDAATVLFGQNLKTVMAEKRIENTDLARAVGRDAGTVSRWRAGKQSPSVADLGKIAEYLAVPAFLLLVPRHPETDVLNALKMARDGIEGGRRESLGQLLDVVVSTLSWAGVERWSVPGSKAPAVDLSAARPGRLVDAMERGTSNKPPARRTAGGRKHG